MNFFYCSPVTRAGSQVNLYRVARTSTGIIIGTWCGKKFHPPKVAARPGFDAIPAVRNNRLHEIKSAMILQPGPAALTDGLAALHAIIAR